MATVASHHQQSPQTRWLASWVEDVKSATTRATRKRPAMSSPPRSPSPTKRPRRQPGTYRDDVASTESCAQSMSDAEHQNPDDTASTPRPSRGRVFDTVARAQPAPSLVSSPSSNSITSLASSTTSQRSRTSISPRKRALALLQADDLPIVSYPMSNIHSHAGMTTATRNLLEDLTKIRARQGIFPQQLKQHIQETSDPLVDAIGDYMFSIDKADTTPTLSTSLDAPLTVAASSGILDRLFAHRSIIEVVAASNFCADPIRPVNEAGWNDRVHARVLDMALKEATCLLFHNITTVSPAHDFRDPNPTLKDSKIDYGIFLSPSSTEPLKDAFDSFLRARRGPVGFPVRQLNALHQFESDRPMSVGIETKREHGGDAQGSNQLANWARIHFRHLRSILRAVAPRKKPFPTDILTLPLIAVEGARWDLKLAFYRPSGSGEQTTGTVVIYDRVSLGSTASVTDCYALLCALRRLGTWCEDAYAVAWKDLLHDNERPG
ncbi:uncharacterized protein B0I36DRAFT_338103 [Microdochium trichocladiopsis]|uniref:PD-(D/E)XK nuclease-like domain-containing protein n=1 Tax=Microdochium trichocladiopsis TaxID=1682393 RepID=A0A9P8XTP1_9PEZI|nr:uncharacterized protein B0I36DRAFT_338103 [Microdochium trichocladiopsis]KAH7016561.1 hypothetical protein B0I36DRAFT_338103 [Microdochium trichocladiopsis]